MVPCKMLFASQQNIELRGNQKGEELASFYLNYQRKKGVQKKTNKQKSDSLYFGSQLTLSLPLVSMKKLSWNLCLLSKCE